MEATKYFHSFYTAQNCFRFFVIHSPYFVFNSNVSAQSDGR